MAKSRAQVILMLHLWPVPWGHRVPLVLAECAGRGGSIQARLEQRPPGCEQVWWVHGSSQGP